MAPYMQTLARTAEFKRIRFVRVDIEAVPAVAEKCNVKALPTYQLYKNGEKLEEMSGALPSKLVAMLKEHCLLYTSPSPRDRTRSRMPSSA